MDIIDIDKLLDRAENDFPFWYPFGVDIPANTQNTLPVTISSDADFWCQYIVGQYTTLGAGPADLGACGISLQIIDQGYGVTLIDALTPVSLFLSPGRTRAAGVSPVRFFLDNHTVSMLFR